MSVTITRDSGAAQLRSASERQPLAVLLVLFTLSGVAGLIYEIVWFQLLRLTIGGNSQSLGVLLACFMGGLFLGSLLYARIVPRHWHPLKTYALIELGIAACGLALPYLIAAIRGFYLTHADSPGTALLLRSAVCLLALAPPTILMGATLPALSRWVHSDTQQAAGISRLYAANIVGAVVGVFGSAMVLLPLIGVIGTNLVAVGINVAVALLAMAVARPYAAATPQPGEPIAALPGATLVYFAYAVSGMTALAFEVLWARLMGSVLGATVYAFAMVLGVFLTGLAVGGAVGSGVAPRLQNPRRTFAELQLAVMGVIGATSLLVPVMADFLADYDLFYHGNLWVLTINNLIRTTLLVLPGAFFWGMCFPVALVALGPRLDDAARPVGRLYAFNTVGAVVGSLATSFLLIPHHGTSMGTAHLVWLPLIAILALYWPRRLPAWSAAVPVVAAAAVAFGTDLPRQVCTAGRYWAQYLDESWQYWLFVFLPLILGYHLFLIERIPRRLALGAAGTGLLLAVSTSVPSELYQLGRRYGSTRLVGTQQGEIVLFEEGTMEPVVVYRSEEGPLEVSINSQLCASSVPAAMAHLRLLGHLPALLSSDPRESLVVGLGAGVTAGCLGIHQDVERVQVIELEPKVKLAAAEFADSNHRVMDNPRVQIRIDDGRHFIATTPRKFGVITSDPIEPFWAGSAALYTVEHYRRCRERLIEGGVFVQWLGIYGLDEDGLRCLLKAFAEAFPEGAVWMTDSELMLVGSTGPLRVDVQALRQKLAAEPAVADSLAFVGIRSVEDLLGHHLCSVDSLQGFLVGVEPNRDSSLVIQYVGWQAFYQSDRWNMVLRQLLAKHRQNDPDVFIVPETQKAAFYEGLRRQWGKIDPLGASPPPQPATQSD